MTCTARSKRTGQGCKGKAIPGKTVCHWHGGRTLSGEASLHFKHGRYSKDLPTRLFARFQVGKEDPLLLELREDIALIDARLGELIGRAEKGDAGAIWDALAKASAEFQKTQARRDTAAAGLALEEMLRLIHTGAQDVAAWREIHTLLEQRRRFVESERKRLIDAEQMMTVEQAVLYFRALTNAITTHVHDRSTIESIKAEFRRLSEGGNLPGTRLKS